MKINKHIAHFRKYRCIAVAISAAIVLCLGQISVATAQEDTKKTAVQLENTTKRLEDIRKQIVLSETQKKKIAGEIAAVENDRAQINRQLIERSRSARKLEARIEKTDQRLNELELEQNTIRQSLNSRKSVLAEVLAALQRLGTKPPPALLVTPGDALGSVRSAILLGAVVPEIRAETVILLNEISQLKLVSSKIRDTRATILSDLEKAAEEENRLDLLLLEKQKFASTARAQLADESVKIAELVANATSLGRLIGNLEERIESARKSADAARKADEQSNAERQDRIAAGLQEIEKPDFSDVSRIKPAVQFADANGLLPMPVRGVITTDFGQIDEFGSAANGVSIATRIEARIIAPADSWVVYRGPFRSYGQLLILNAGSGYHVVLAGMESTNVELGQFVLSGEPVGKMGAKRIASSSIANAGSTRPVLYIEFRKDGKSIDPTPWWSDASKERVSDDS